MKTRVRIFQGSSIKEVEEQLDRWLSHPLPFEIVAVSQSDTTSEEHGRRFVVTVFFNPAD